MDVRYAVLAFIAYWGIVLFGYDTYVSFHTVFTALPDSLLCRGVAGGVVSQDAFKEHFLMDKNGNISSHDVTNVSGNVVSVLQAGAFFGALGSAPISGMYPSAISRSFQIHLRLSFRAQLELVEGTL